MSKPREATQRKKRINFSLAELCIILKWKLIYDNASLKSRDSKARDIIKGHEVNKKIMEAHYYDCGGGFTDLYGCQILIKLLSLNIISLLHVTYTLLRLQKYNSK